MASLTIRNLDAPLKLMLRVRAASHGRSMEEEVRVILRDALSEAPQRLHPAEAIRRRFADLGGVELPEIARGPDRDPPDFSE